MPEDRVIHVPTHIPLPCDAPLAMLDFPPRMLVALRRFGMATIADLLATSPAHLRTGTHIGPTTVARVAERLQAYGYMWPMTGSHGPSDLAVTPLHVLDLPTRVRHILERHGITTIAQVVACDRQTLVGLSGMGPQTVTLLVDQVQAHGYTFGPQPDQTVIDPTLPLTTRDLPP